MTIVFYCSGCKALIRAKSELAGRKGKCQKCGVAITVPQKSEAGAVARQLAKDFWNSPAAASAKTTGVGICDYCNADVAIGRGYLTPPMATDDLYPSIACDNCFNANRLSPWNGDVSQMPHEHAQAFATVSKAAKELCQTASENPEKSIVDALNTKMPDSAWRTMLYMSVSRCNSCGLILPVTQVDAGPQAASLTFGGVSAAAQKSPEAIAALYKVLCDYFGESPSLDLKDTFGMIKLCAFFMMEKCERCNQPICKRCVKKPHGARGCVVCSKSK